MSRLLICCEDDLPSVNMRTHLLKKREWDDLGTDGRNTFASYGNTVMMSISEKHVTAEDIDTVATDFGVKVEEIVFMSRHSAASGMPTLTVHPIGNYKEVTLGGRPRMLVRSAPHLMSDALRRIGKLNDTDVYNVSFEVTHHGPFVSVPTMFIEVGSDESHWGDTHAAEILADVILSMEGDCDNMVAIGIGGGHYAPRFTEFALSHKIDFGHMLPNYQLENSTDDEITAMVKSAAEATGTKMVYVHRNSMKKSEERRLNGLIDSLGLERISSKDIDPLV